MIYGNSRYGSSIEKKLEKKRHQNCCVSIENVPISPSEERNFLGFNTPTFAFYPLLLGFMHGSNEKLVR